MLKASLNYNSSWVLFSPVIPTAAQPAVKKSLGFLSDDSSDTDQTAKEFRPMCFFGKTHSPVDRSEQDLIRKMRLWLQKVSHTIKFIDTSKITLLSDVAKTEYFEYDLIVRVLHMFKKEESRSEVSFIDMSGEIGYTEVYTNKFKWLREGQVVKIKGASKYKQTEGNLLIKYSTNILTIPAEMKIAEELLELETSKSLQREA